MTRLTTPRFSGYAPGTRFLLVPGTPTPNGPLHLGHIAGPFLRLDVLRRFLVMAGYDARMVSGTDSHESYVSLTAYAEGSDEPTVASRFHEEIEIGLRLLDIGCDRFLDPLRPDIAPAYLRWHTEVMTRLRTQEVVEVREEQLPYASDTERPLLGCWLLGRCPRCDASMGGYACEDCGNYFPPTAVREPADRRGMPLTWRATRSQFLRLPEEAVLVDAMRACRITDAQQEPARRYVRDYGPYLRLTHPMSWGVRDNVVPAGQVYFSYSVGQFAYALLAGEIDGELRGTGVNALLPSSGVVTIASGGLDNIVPNVLGNVGIAFGLRDYRPYDHLLVNRFLQLEGKKFSTSRRHVIWTRDIIELAGVESDAVRWYLATIDPVDDATDFRVHDFLEVVNGFLVGQLWATTERHLRQVRRPEQPCTPTIMTALAEHFGDLVSALDITQCRPAAVPAIVTSWLRAEPSIAREPDGAYWWLKGLALLAHPVMPRLGAQLWSSLGHRGEPTLDELERVLPFDVGAIAPAFRPVDAARFARCLPASLTADLHAPRNEAS